MAAIVSHTLRSAHAFSDMGHGSVPSASLTLDTKIGARFDLEKYRLREALLSSRDRQTSTFPAGFPEKLNSASDWSGRSLDLEGITYHVTDQDVAELEQAVQAFNESGRSLNELNRATFSLPKMATRLRAISFEIHEGKAAAIIRGLQPDRYSLYDNIVLFAGLSSWVGDQRGSQSSANDVLTHLCSKNAKRVHDPRPGLSNHSLPFHNDHCDILALYALEASESGNEAMWASAAKVYNEMCRTKPHVIPVLATEDWPHETAVKTVKNLPILFQDDSGVPFFNFTRFACTGLPSYPRSPHIPDLSDEQADALDAIQYLAAKHRVQVPQLKGDIFLLNNRAVMHARNRIEETEGGRERHLLRLCLRDTEHGRSIPPALQRRWGDIFDKDQDRDAKWMLTKDAPASFISASQFDARFDDETATGSHG